jgi:hypothetical protein
VGLACDGRWDRADDLPAVVNGGGRDLAEVAPVEADHGAILPEDVAESFLVAHHSIGSSILLSSAPISM